MDTTFEGAEYLGDGLYAKFDGYQIALLANNGLSTSNVVYLDPYTVRAFLAYVERLEGKKGE